MKKSLGFTLIEILIALTIFSIMATITSSVLYAVFQSRDKTISHAVKLSEVQMAFVLIERDLTQIVNHPIKTALTKESAVLGEENIIHFTRGGIVNPLNSKKESTFNRVIYLLENGIFLRKNQMAVNTNQTISHYEKILLTDITELRFNYIDANNQVLSHWYNKKLPKAIRITIKTKQWGKLSQIYSLPQSRSYYEKF